MEHEPLCGGRRPAVYCPALRSHFRASFPPLLQSPKRTYSQRGCYVIAQSSLYTRAVSGLLFPLHERLKGHETVAMLRSLERSQWWSRDAIEGHRITLLKELLADAAMHVPYYQKVMAEREIHSKSVTSLSDLALLPFLDKPTIRANVDSLRSDQARSLKRSSTSGSTGEPLVFYLGKERITHDVAAKWRATRWWGVDIGDPEAVVWGSPIELGAQDRMRGLRDRVLRSRLLPAFEMSPGKIDQFLDRIRAMRPRMVFGYPSSIAFIARHAQARNCRLDDLGVKVVFVTAEELYDDQRQAIEAAFGCKVANGYGGRDAGFIAHECPSGGMHVTAEHIIVEIVDSAGTPTPTGIPGEIVITHLASRSFPFIRYRTGDVGTLGAEPCACGRGLPVLKDVQGRSSDFIVARDGTTMHAAALRYVLRDLPGIDQFKVIQESLDLTRVLIVPNADFQAALIPQIQAGFKARLGQDVDIRVDLSAALPPEKSGKFRHVLSRLRQSP